MVMILLLFRRLSWMNEYHMRRNFTNPMHLEALLAQAVRYVLTRFFSNRILYYNLSSVLKNKGVELIWVLFKPFRHPVFIFSYQCIYIFSGPLGDQSRIHFVLRIWIPLSRWGMRDLTLFIICHEQTQ